MRIRFLFFLFCLITYQIGSAQYTISGYVTDTNSGETLIGANVVLSSDESIGVSTNTYGFYSISLEAGEHILRCSYLGYEDQIINVDVSDNRKLNFSMSEGLAIEEVVISAEKEEADKNVESTEMGTIEVPMAQIKKLPAIFGEVDLLKAIQLLPGVLSSGEGSAGFYVRGGGPDQNLVLLDEAVVYNSGHLLGFFSVFNADAIKNTSLIKGNMPAKYGGRLSSVLDIQMKDGNDQSYKAQGGIGLVASRLTVEGPIIKDKSSFIISGRRTYIGDLAQPALNDSDFKGSNYYFYDLNAKINYRLSQKDRLFFSTYFGRDVFRFSQIKRDFRFNLPYGNATATARWNHLFSDKLFFNLSAIYNDYQFQFDGGQDQFQFELFSGVKDYTLKADFEYFYNNDHTIKFGINYTNHELTPNTATATNGDVDFATEYLPKYANEWGLYVQDDIKITSKLSANVGLRLSLFSQLGPYESKLGNGSFEDWETVKNYFGFEPRASMKYTIDPSLSFKAGIAQTYQYIHLVSNSSSTLPTDIWVPSSEIVKPQRGLQYALGLFKNWKDNTYETNIEVYYKDLRNQIDYSEDFVEDLSQEVEDAFVFGKGRAYGAEFFLKKAKGKLNGWIGYTLSKSERSFDDIEGGRWYSTVYDKTHDLSIVANYKIGRKWDLGAVAIYGTGRNYTPVGGFFLIEQNINLWYGPRNSARLDPYHRIDLSATFTPKPDSKKKWKSSWTLSVYNAYNRKNPFFILYDADVNLETGNVEISGDKITLFPIIPSITYNFTWN